eukprot:gene136-biopygen9151
MDFNGPGLVQCRLAWAHQVDAPAGTEMGWRWVDEVDVGHAEHIGREFIPISGPETPDPHPPFDSHICFAAHLEPVCRSRPPGRPGPDRVKKSWAMWAGVSMIPPFSWPGPGARDPAITRDTGPGTRA